MICNSRRGSARSCGYLWLIALFLVGLAQSSPLFAEDAQQLGLAKAEPPAGPVVRTDRGYMVPYTTTIPGTDVKFSMVPIPGGRFTMGSPDAEAGRAKNEGPQVVVEVEPFWMGAYEVTWAEYKQYMDLHDVFRAFDAKGFRKVTDERALDAVTAPSRLYDPDTTFQSGDDPQQPAVMMTQYASKQYTKWLSAVTGHFYRLPGEAEWEHACRANSQTAFHFGDDPTRLDDYAWYAENAEERTHKVGQKKPNPWGLYDMHGNAAEWVLDEFTDDGYARFKQQPISSRDAINWPSEVFPRVLRGGSFEMSARKCRSASRLASEDEEWKEDDPNLPASPWWFTTTPATGVGFRIIRPLTTPADAQAREQYWKADVDEIAEDVASRIYDAQSGAIGIVDKQLPQAIKNLKQP